MIASAFTVCSAVSSCTFVFGGMRSLLFANTRLRNMYCGWSGRKIARPPAGHVVFQADAPAPLGAARRRDDVMHDGALAGQPVDAAHPHVTIERVLDRQHLIRNRAGSRH